MRRRMLVRKHVLLLSVVLICALPAAGAFSPAPQQQGEPPPASGSETALAQSSPKEMAAFQALVETRDPQQRLALVRQFLASYPESSFRNRTYAAGAEAYRMQGNFDQAVEYGEKALELSGRDPLVLILLADALAEGAVSTVPDAQQRLSRAEEYARQALGLLPDMFAAAPQPPDVSSEQFRMQWEYIEAQPHATLGFIYLRRQDYARAEEELQQATALNRIKPNAVDFLRLGFAHMRQEEWAEAKAALERCREIGGSAAATAQQQLEEVAKKLQEQGDTQPGPPEKQ
jgi:tetratricopeptide (TPR) repeat protein